jgi:hypothetical protein
VCGERREMMEREKKRNSVSFEKKKNCMIKIGREGGNDG